MLDKIEAALTPARRKWSYVVTTAGLSVLGVYGLLSDEQAAAWALLAAGVTGMATAHTDTTTPTGMPRRAIEEDE